MLACCVMTSFDGRSHTSILHINYASRPLNLNELVMFAYCVWPPATRLMYDNKLYISDTGPLTSEGNLFHL